MQTKKCFGILKLVENIFYLFFALELLVEQNIMIQSEKQIP